MKVAVEKNHKAVERAKTFTAHRNSRSKHGF